MDSHVIFDAIGMIDDQYIVSAQKRFGYQLPQSASAPEEFSGRHIRGRAFISIAAALLLLISSFVTVMAVNEEFREKIFAFFHISTTENVPDGDNADIQGTTADLGDRVSAEYLNVGKELSLTGNGTLYDAEYDGTGNVRGVSFYRISEGALQTLTTNITRFEIVASGVPVSGSVYWCFSDGSLTAIGRGRATDQSKTWYISTISRQPDVVLLSVFGGIADHLDFHAFLLNLNTGNADPIFSDTGLCKLTHVQDIQLTSDCKYGLVLGRSDHDLDPVPYLYSLQSGQLISLQEAAGEEITDKAFLTDDNTVLLTSKANNRYSCWAYSISESTMEKTIDGMPLDSSNADAGRIVDFGSRYVFCVYENGAAVVIDQKSGLRSPVIDGFTYDDRAGVLVSADGRKACYYVSADPYGSYGSLSIETLGVIDFNTARFTVFDRSGFEKNQEFRLGWIDSNKVCISVVGDQSDLYVYEFE